VKAAFIEQFGGPDVIKYGDLPDPVAAPGQVVVDVVAASVNGADWRVRAGLYAETKFPLVLGRDFSGTVAALGAGVDDLEVGDAVFGVLEAGREGAYAEKVAITAAIVAKKPAALSHTDAAALALTGITALISIETTLRLQRGETILIQGGAGGVASVAIQIAKHIGARVITTTSAANIDYVRGLGADQVIDYTAQDFTRVVSGCDAVFDTVGGDVAQKSFAVLRPGGRGAFIASGMQAPKSERDDVTAHRRTCGDRRRTSAGNQAVPFIASRRSTSRQRRPPLPRQAHLAGALECNERRHCEKHSDEAIQRHEHRPWIASLRSQ
jgi:NADPH:quinone reductase-like Zn-dependent oxidoreductase